MATDKLKEGIEGFSRGAGESGEAAGQTAGGTGVARACSGLSLKSQLVPTGQPTRLPFSLELKLGYQWLPPPHVSDLAHIPSATIRLKFLPSKQIQRWPGTWSGLRTLHPGHEHAELLRLSGTRYAGTALIRSNRSFSRQFATAMKADLGLGPEITGYVSRMLCDFSEADSLFRLRDAKGRPIES